MGKPNRIQKSKFRLTGQILHFIPVERDCPKALLLGTAAGLHRVKLAKPLRAKTKRNFQLGDWVEVVGKCQLDRQKGRTKLKAKRIAAKLNDSASHSTVSPPVAPPPTAPETVAAPPSAQNKPIANALGKNPAKPAAPSERPQATVLVCGKSGCKKRGGKAVCQALEKHVRDRGLEDCVTIKSTGCLKRCKAGPNVVVLTDKTRYSRI